MANSVTRRLLVEEAQRRGWKTETIGHKAYLLKITDHTGRSELIRGTRTRLSSSTGLTIALHKNVTCSFIEELGYEVVPYCVPNNMEEALAFMFAHRSIVVKPDDSERGRGVKVNVRDVDMLRQAMETARGYSPSSTVMLQQHMSGTLYRLMVLNGRFVGAMERKPAEVVGDGTHTVRQLIEQQNQDPRRGLARDSVLKKITVSSAIDLLGKDGVQFVPPKGKTVRVSVIGGVGAGGENANVSAVVHPEWQRILVEVASKAGLFIAGFDVLCEDIAAAPPQQLPILEMNSMPGLKLVHYPTAGGEPIDLAKLFLDELFAAGQA